MKISSFIRPPVAGDGDAMMGLGRACFIEAGYDYPYDAASFAYSLMLLAEAGTMLVIDHDGEAVGMAAAVVFPAFWNRDVLLAREAFWFVDPAHRKGIGAQLLKALEAMLAERGVQSFDTVAEDGARSAALSRLYRAGGFAPAEAVYRKRLVNGGHA